MSTHGRARDTGGVTLGEEEARAVRAIIDAAAGALRDVGDTLRSKIERARGLLMPAPAHHDAGAAARCSWCARYTIDLRALRPSTDPTCPQCTCGERTYWSGSFSRPGRDARWVLP